MQRRQLITLVGGTVIAWPLTARAQEPRPVIGVLSSLGSSGIFAEVIMPAFSQGLKDAGFVEGRNVSIEIHDADGRYDRLPSLAAELVRRDVAAIFATDVPSTFAAKAATQTIPIVFVTGADPVKVGLVDNLNRPTGNLTGMSVFASVLGPKRVELLHETLPRLIACQPLFNRSAVPVIGKVKTLAGPSITEPDTAQFSPRSETPQMCGGFVFGGYLDFMHLAHGH